MIEESNFLLDHGANLHDTNGGLNPLHIASIARAYECVCLLVERGADINQSCGQVTPLSWAIGGGDLRIIKYLLMKGADMHAGIDPAFWRAATWSGLEVFTFLVESDSRPNKDNYKNALFGAAVNHNYDIKGKIIKLLLEKGVPVNVQCIMSGLTPLHRAACDPHNAETIRLLLEQGADPNKAENGGNTPLMAAARYGSAQIVQDLLHGGADRSIENKQGKRACDIARKNGKEDIVRILSKDKIA